MGVVPVLPERQQCQQPDGFRRQKRLPEIPEILEIPLGGSQCNIRPPADVSAP
jgi:hypothetical protein